ncbi:MAG: exopolyphosphatase [Methylovulum sp.]|nr:exopolyphosphatase [Methylovulum sp.]
MQKTTPEIVAAVDLGSNSFHMIVCRLHEGKLTTLDSLKEMVRLASGLDKNTVLSQETQQRALNCLERFGQRIRTIPPENVRIVGTNTLRTAKNVDDFLIKAELALNHPIHIISGIEEARLIYQGVAHSLGSNAQRRLVMDIGGGSTEYIIGANNVPEEKESLHMGCVSISHLFFKQGVINKDDFARAVLFAEQQLEPFGKKFQRKNWHEAIGASGSLRSIAKVLEAKNWSNNGITKQGLELLVDYLLSCKHISELNFPDFDPERLPVFPGGVAIAYATFKSLKIEQMTVSDGALREGLIQDILGRLYHHDIRSDTTKMLAKRFHTDHPHALRIQHTITHILTRLMSSHAWAGEEDSRQFLHWAAELHEIGHDIAHSQYHKHSAYIVEYGDLAGFSRQDQLLLATLIRNHRRKFSTTQIKKLPELWQTKISYLIIVLRLAVLLRRNRDENELPNVDISFSKKKIHLNFPLLWLDQAPLTRADLNQEAEYLKAASFSLVFS